MEAGPLPGQLQDGGDEVRATSSETSSERQRATLASRRRALLTLDLGAVRPFSDQPGGGAAASSPGGSPISASEAALRFHAEYELGPAIGSGSIAVVKRARRRADGREVAVKCIKSCDEEVQQFARDEYELLRSVSHPAIVRVEALHASGRQVWTVMELCEGGSLQAHVLHKGPLPEDRAGRLFRQLLEAVNYLHQRRIVHRDLKPENCLLAGADLAEGPVLKVTDFNSAKVIGRGNGSSAMLTSRGTLAFSAPELLLGRCWNERVDIWACGLCLYFVLCGRSPFDCKAPRVQEALAAGRLPEVRWYSVSPTARDLVYQCLAVDVRDRPPAMKLLVHPFLSLPLEPRKPGAVTGWFESFVSAYAKQLNLICCTSRSAAGRQPAYVSWGKLGSMDHLTEQYSLIYCASMAAAGSRLQRATSSPDGLAGLPCCGAGAAARPGPPASGSYSVRAASAPPSLHKEAHDTLGLVAIATH